MGINLDIESSPLSRTTDALCPYITNPLILKSQVVVFIFSVKTLSLSPPKASTEASSLREK